MRIPFISSSSFLNIRPQSLPLADEQPSNPRSGSTVRVPPGSLHPIPRQNPPLAFRTVHPTQPAKEQIPHTSTTSATEPITHIAKLNSNQHSLETPQNKAGMQVFHHLRHCIYFALSEYVLSTLDKITNWARQSSMWPMTFGT